MSSPNNYELILTDPARDDLESIAAYSYLHWGEEQTRLYMVQLYESVTMIAGDPCVGRPRYGVPQTIKGKKVGRHVIFYRVQQCRIFILRILHESMDYGRKLQ